MWHLDGTVSLDNRFRMSLSCWLKVIPRSWPPSPPIARPVLLLVNNPACSRPFAMSARQLLCCLVRKVSRELNYTYWKWSRSVKTFFHFRLHNKFLILTARTHLWRTNQLVTRQTKILCWTFWEVTNFETDPLKFYKQPKAKCNSPHLFPKIDPVRNMTFHLNKVGITLCKWGFSAARPMELSQKKIDSQRGNREN